MKLGHNVVVGEHLSLQWKSHHVWIPRPLINQQGQLNILYLCSSVLNKQWWSREGYLLSLGWG